MLHALDDIDTFIDKYTIVPTKSDIFNMFRMLRPEKVRVVMVAQSPYPGYCPATRTQYACGPAFVPAHGCVTTPATLRNIVAEVCRDMSASSLQCNPRDMLLDWVGQGVLLLNSSLTLGVGCPKYLEDHSVLWEEPMRAILTSIADVVHPVFVLVGKDAWKYENCLTRVVKVSHPVASNYRKDVVSFPWIGSSVFSQVSRMMIENGDVPIKWTKRRVHPLRWPIKTVRKEEASASLADTSASLAR